jgi:hypothetical protein
LNVLWPLSCTLGWGEKLILSRPNSRSAFYDRVREARDYHKRYPSSGFTQVHLSTILRSTQFLAKRVALMSHSASLVLPTRYTYVTLLKAPLTKPGAHFCELIVILSESEWLASSPVSLALHKRTYLIIIIIIIIVIIIIKLAC